MGITLADDQSTSDDLESSDMQLRPPVNVIPGSDDLALLDKVVDSVHASIERRLEQIAGSLERRGSSVEAQVIASNVVEDVLSNRVPRALATLLRAESLDASNPPPDA